MAKLDVKLKQLFGRKPRVGLSLAGGGAKGVAYIPFLRALEELDVEIAAISGSSIGAAIGGLYAAGLGPGELVGVLDSFRPGHLHEVFRINWRGRGLISGKSVRKFLEATLPVERFDQTRIPLKVVATDYWRREQVVFDSGSLVDAIQASTAVPAVFEPLVLDGRVLVDGSIKNTLPYELLRDECDFTIGLDVSNRAKDPDRTDLPRTLVMVLNTFRILTDSNTEYKLRYDPVDLYFRLKLPDIEMLDFYKYREIFDSVEPEVKEFIRELSEKLRL
ncbi:MAG: patatin-like phospholipase family protein [Spirochaetaceae bacterium]